MRLKKKADFRVHVLIYVLVNTFLIAIWAMSGAGFFWPVFPLVGWGSGLLRTLGTLTATTCRPPTARSTGRWNGCGLGSDIHTLLVKGLAAAGALTARQIH